MKIKVWIEAARPRTLILAIASITMGGFLALYSDVFQWDVFLLSLLTTSNLQILSNFANDFGDSQHGADSNFREGPKRAVQNGMITKQSMKKAIYLFVLFSFISGIALLYIALESIQIDFVLLLLIGLVAIGAAIKYTAGKNPYGYAGWGDFFVLVFFGVIGVLGSYFLYSKIIEWSFILPALSCGFFAVAVLNVNNIRDINSDKEAGKKSIPVRIGRKNAVIYHFVLLFLGISASILFVLLNYESLYQWMFLLCMPLLVINALGVYNKKESKKIDPYLKHMAFTTFFYVITFGVGHLIST